MSGPECVPGTHSGPGDGSSVDCMSSADRALAAKVVTVSDGVVHGTRDDLSGKALVEQLTAAGFDVIEHRLTADGALEVATVLTEMSEGFAGLIVTTGGTGFAPRDQTPEGTRALSSSTRKSPSSSRIRSIPETWTRTPLGGENPATTRW